jgi:hypothetical protein
MYSRIRREDIHALRRIFETHLSAPFWMMSINEGQTAIRLFIFLLLDQMLTMHMK